MAANPRVPPEQKPVPTIVQQQKKSASPLVPLGILAAALLLIAILYFMPRAPKQGMAPTSADVPVQPVNGQIQLSNVRISEAPTGGQLYLYTTMHNQGETAITGVRARVIFSDQNGQPSQALEGVAEAVQNGAGVNLVDDPIKPGQSREVRVNVQNVPQNWNRQLPTIEIADVTSVGAKQ